MVKFNNEEILIGLQKNDKNIIRYVYEIAYFHIEQLVTGSFGSDEDAQDVFQEAMMVLYMNSAKPEFELKSSFTTYLYGIAKNIWYSRLREQRLNTDEDVEFDLIIKEEPDYYELNERLEKWKLFKDYFDTLSMSCKQVLTLVFNGISIDQITKLMGYSGYQFTTTRIYKCKMKLIKRIKRNPKFKELENELFKLT